jgi:hypothetical protein
MCAPAVVAGVASAGQGIIGAFGANRQRQARNQARANEYKRALEERKRRWLQATSQYSAKKVAYSKNIDEATMAERRGYTQGQEFMNRKIATANQKFVERIAKNLQEQKGFEQTGKSSERLAAMQFAQQVGRPTGEDTYQLIRSGEAVAENNRGIRRRAMAKRSELFTKVAFAPQQDIAPPPPVMERSNLGLNIAGAVLGGVGSYYSAGGTFGFKE